MSEATPERLNRVQANLVEMTKLVRVAMMCATEALLSADVHLAEQVITDDSAINAINASIEQSCLEILSTPHLTPNDIRMTVASLRMSTTLERMGDLAAHVAKQARLRFPFVSVPDELHDTFAQMGAIANAIIERAARVIETSDLRYAADIQAEDEIMDTIHRELFSKVLDPAWSHGVEGAIDVTLLSRFYERFADHGVTIARRIAFVVTGENYGVSDLATAADSE